VGFALAQLPTLYEHYTNGGIRSGLVPTADGFLLNGKSIRIVSGAIHYFRVHPAYWRDRLRKLRASGANAVETYVPWNLHEPEMGVYDFGQGNNDMSIFLDLVTYIKIAQEEDLFVIFRPGPYICSEWDFGGLPSWLMIDTSMQVRTSYPPYISRVDLYFDQLLPLVTDLQFTRGNGPIIAVQIENEYGAFGYGDQPRDKVYLAHLRDKMTSLGVESMYFTSDTPTNSRDWGSIEGALQTANFQTGAAAQFDALQIYQPNLPLMATEFWSGWFDHWGQGYHDGSTAKSFSDTLNEIFSFGASVNFYMFHGGTNFGFMNGANNQADYPYYQPDVTSYDYDSLLSEAGDYTPKYDMAQAIISSALTVQTLLPARPAATVKRAFASTGLAAYLTVADIISQVPSSLLIQSRTVLSMENLPINNGNGQSYGFTVYRKTVNIGAMSELQIRGHVRDFALVFINGQQQLPPVLSSSDLKNFGTWVPSDAKFTLSSWRAMEGVPLNGKADAVLEIMVENLGRTNYGQPHDFNQLKGLWEGAVSIDGTVLEDWEIIPLEFKSSWVASLTNWRANASLNTDGPALFRADFTVDTPADTFLDMTEWGKGVVFINGFNLGRYWSYIGPQMTLYIPAPLLKTGSNTITIFEQYKAASQIKFVDAPSLGNCAPWLC